ncbi:MAG: protein kinase, partial [Candidatus Hydrogenedentales bacterium]
HPGIVTVYDEGVLDGQPYFVLEYVASSAKQLLDEEDGRLELKRACEIAAQIADALEFAHGEGYIHRDVKPGNILIEARNGRAKLADFGLARLDRLDAVDSTGNVMRGTPPYMAPEYLRGEDKPNPRTDIYALGVSLYELLSRALPYEGKSTNEIIDKIRANKRVPLQERAPDLPAAVLDIVDKATAYDPKDRYQSATEMKADLDAVLESLSGSRERSSADLTTRRLSRKQKLGLVTVGSLAAFAIAAVLMLVLVSQPTFGERIDMADRLMDDGRAAESEQIYRELLAAQPGSAAVEYGLGYALLQQGKTDEASDVFGAVDEEPLQREGTFAVALASSPEHARAFVESTQGDAVTSYFKTLAARLDFLEANHANVLQRLAELEQAGFRFKWQYAEALELLGRALKAAERPEDARATFEAMAAVAGGAQSARADDYLASLTREEANAARVERLRAQLQDIRARMDETCYTPPTPAERWRSRPIRFTVSAAQNSGSLLGVEYGLEDRLPVWLERELTENTPYVALSRTNLDDVLLEQDIALELASEEGAIQLQQLLAGRVTIEPRLSRFGEEEILEFRIVDNETSESAW